MACQIIVASFWPDNPGAGMRRVVSPNFGGIAWYSCISKPKTINVRSKSKIGVSNYRLAYQIIVACTSPHLKVTTLASHLQ